MIYLQTVKGTYDRMELLDVSFINSEYNISDSFAKVKRHAFIQGAFRSSYLRHPIQQLIIRGDKIKIYYGILLFQNGD